MKQVGNTLCMMGTLIMGGMLMVGAYHLVVLIGWVGWSGMAVGCLVLGIILMWADDAFECDMTRCPSCRRIIENKKGTECFHCGYTLRRRGK